MVRKWTQQTVCPVEEVCNIIGDDAGKGENEMSQVLERIRTNDIPDEVREWLITEAKKRKVSPELLSAVTKSILKYHELYKSLAKK